MGSELIEISRALGEIDGKLTEGFKRFDKRFDSIEEHNKKQDEQIDDLAKGKSRANGEKVGSKKTLSYIAIIIGIIASSIAIWAKVSK